MNDRYLSFFFGGETTAGWLDLAGASSTRTKKKRPKRREMNGQEGKEATRLALMWDFEFGMIGGSTERQAGQCFVFLCLVFFFFVIAPFCFYFFCWPCFFSFPSIITNSLCFFILSLSILFLVLLLSLLLLSSGEMDLFLCFLFILFTSCVMCLAPLGWFHLFRFILCYRPFCCHLLCLLLGNFAYGVAQLGLRIRHSTAQQVDLLGGKEGVSIRLEGEQAEERREERNMEGKGKFVIISVKVSTHLSIYLPPHVTYYCRLCGFLLLSRYWTTIFSSCEFCVFRDCQTQLSFTYLWS